MESEELDAAGRGVDKSGQPGGLLFEQANFEEGQRIKVVFAKLCNYNGGLFN